MISGRHGRSIGRAIFAWAIILVGFGGRPARAELRFDQPVVNAGETKAGIRLVHRFGFRNAGSEPAQITETRVSCGCLTPRLEQGIYRPGERGVLRLEVNTLGEPAGPHAWTVQVRYRCGNRYQEIPLRLTARIITEISVRPAALTIYPAGAAHHDITLTDFRTKPLAITAIDSTSPKLTPRLMGKTRDNEGNPVQPIRIEVAEDFPEGRHRETVTLYTDDARYRELTIPVTVVKGPRQRLAALPDQVKLTAAPGAPLPSQMIRLRDSNNETVEVERVVADHPAITYRWAPGPSTMATLKILVDHRRITGGRLNSAVHVHLRKPVRETVTISVVVEGE
jgi:hypothetical protein